MYLLVVFAFIIVFSPGVYLFHKRTAATPFSFAKLQAALPFAFITATLGYTLAFLFFFRLPNIALCAVGLVVTTALSYWLARLYAELIWKYLPAPRAMTSMDKGLAFLVILVVFFIVSTPRLHQFQGTVEYLFVDEFGHFFKMIALGFKGDYLLPSHYYNAKLYFSYYWAFHTLPSSLGYTLEALAGDFDYSGLHCLPMVWATFTLIFGVVLVLIPMRLGASSLFLCLGLTAFGMERFFELPAVPWVFSHNEWYFGNIQITSVPVLMLWVPHHLWAMLLFAFAVFLFYCLIKQGGTQGIGLEHGFALGLLVALAFFASPIVFIPAFIAASLSVLVMALIRREGDLSFANIIALLPRNAGFYIAAFIPCVAVIVLAKYIFVGQRAPGGVEQGMEGSISLTPLFQTIKFNYVKSFGLDLLPFDLKVLGAALMKILFEGFYFLTIPLVLLNARLRRNARLQFFIVGTLITIALTHFVVVYTFDWIMRGMIFAQIACLGLAAYLWRLGAKYRLVFFALWMLGVPGIISELGWPALAIPQEPRIYEQFNAPTPNPLFALDNGIVSTQPVRFSPYASLPKDGYGRFQCANTSELMRAIYGGLNAVNAPKQVFGYDYFIRSKDLERLP